MALGRVEVVLSGDPAAEITALKDKVARNILVAGSSRLVHLLAARDLVDQYNLMIFPVVLGTGKKALEETPDRRNLKLKDSQVVGDGVVVLTYERA